MTDCRNSPPTWPILVRLLVREMSGLWYVDQGFMTEKMARQHRAGWNKIGFRCLILKHSFRRANLPIVDRPVVPLSMVPWRFK